MKWRAWERDGAKMALVDEGEAVILDGQTALDALMTLCYESGARAFTLPLGRLTPDFFQLSTGIAGDVLQKVSNYRLRLAIWGDFSAFHSPALQAFIAESNRGNTVFFCGSEAEAIARLAPGS